MKLLIAEDNEFNQMVLNDILELIYPDVEIDIKDSAKDALDTIEDFDQYDLILSDIDMPHMNGFEFYTQLRENRNYTKPVIAVTALAIKGDEEKMLAHGFDAYISKPIDIDVLQSAIGKFI
ncbi:MAG: response regulator [Campylobacterota bacterium]|nr:response regulator [Campylobacterota bacterium]